MLTPKSAWADGAMGRWGRLAASVVWISGRTCEESVAEILWGITVFTTIDTEGQLASVTRLRYSFPWVLQNAAILHRSQKYDLTTPFLDSVAARLKVRAGLLNAD